VALRKAQSRGVVPPIGKTRGDGLGVVANQLTVAKAPGNPKFPLRAAKSPGGG